MKQIFIGIIVTVVGGLIILFIQYTFFDNKNTNKRVNVELSTNKGNSNINIQKNGHLS